MGLSGYAPAGIILIGVVECKITGGLGLCLFVAFAVIGDAGAYGYVLGAYALCHYFTAAAVIPGLDPGAGGALT